MLLNVFLCFCCLQHFMLMRYSHTYRHTGTAAHEKFIYEKSNTFSMLFVAALDVLVTEFCDLFFLCQFLFCAAFWDKKRGKFYIFYEFCVIFVDGRWISLEFLFFFCTCCYWRFLLIIIEGGSVMEFMIISKAWILHFFDTFWNFWRLLIIFWQLWNFETFLIF